MKNVNNNLKMICSAITGMMIGGLTVVGANQAIQAMQNTEIKVSLDGQVQTFKDETTGETQYPITYNNRTYLPLRNVAQLAGLDVDYDTNSNTAILKSKNGLTKSLLERVEPYTSYIRNNFPNDSKDANLSDFIDSEQYVSNASLRNENNHYILSLTVSAPLLFKDAEVQEMLKKLDSNNTAKLSEYTFYKNVDLLKSSYKWSNDYIDLIDNQENKKLLATDDKGTLYYLFEKNNEGLEYKIAGLNVAGTAGWVIMEPVQSIDVELYGNDKVIIKATGSGLKELTVDEYYKKANNKEVDNSSEIQGYVYDLNNLGDCHETFGEYCDSVSFDGDNIVINYKNGGV